MRLGLGRDPHHLARRCWQLGLKFNGSNLKILGDSATTGCLPHPLLDRCLAVIVPSQRQPALQRYWRSSCHGLWKPSRKPGARLIQTLQFIDQRCCHRIGRRVEIACVQTAPWKTVKQARRTLFRLVKDAGSQMDAQGAGLPAARCDVQSMLTSSETSNSEHPSERNGRAIPSVLINADAEASISGGRP